MSRYDSRSDRVHVSFTRETPESVPWTYHDTNTSEKTGIDKSPLRRNRSWVVIVFVGVENCDGHALVHFSTSQGDSAFVPNISGIPVYEASVSLGDGRHVPNRLYARLDREGHPRRVLDLRLLLPPGTCTALLQSCLQGLLEAVHSWEDTPEIGSRL